MVSGGNDGYRALGQYDPLAPVNGPHINWMNSGLKGALASWQRNVALSLQNLKSFRLKI